MKIYFAQSTPVTVNNITFSVSGRKLQITQENYTISVEVQNGDAYYCQTGKIAQKWSNAIFRGQQILRVLGIPIEKWADSYENFENRRKALIDSHKFTLSDTYVRDSFTYMTSSANGKTELQLVWVADEITSDNEIRSIEFALENYSTNQFPGFLILI